VFLKPWRHTRILGVKSTDCWSISGSRTGLRLRGAEVLGRVGRRALRHVLGGCPTEGAWKGLGRETSGLIIATSAHLEHLDSRYSHLLLLHSINT
jgi:hypothetical protein